VLSGNPLILILGIVSAFIFFYLLRIKASKKQTERDNRINWSFLWNKNKVKKNDSE
tara:strand:+ start:1038 stop:1205 length:168 start_codon:yes stop_codon:yes gene_type:complete